MKNNRKFKIKTNKIALMFLTTLTITSVGFSSWLINGFGSFKAELNFNNGEIYYLNQYIYFDGAQDLTKFSANGFLGESSNVGVLKIPFQINTNSNKIKDFFPSKSIDFDILISSTTSTVSNFFTLFSCNNSNLKYSTTSVSYGNNDFEYSKTASESLKSNEKAWSFTFRLDNFELIENSFVAFQFETELVFSNSKNFTNDFFNKLENNQMIKLSMTIGVSA